MNPFIKYSKSYDMLIGDLSVLGGSYIPENFPHREDQLDYMIKTLSSIMRKTKPSNILLYGKTGTGKTSAARYVTNMLSDALDRNINICYINCQIYDSPYSILVTLVNSFSASQQENIPSLGWPMDRIYHELLARLSMTNKYLIIILDEIDKLIEKNGGDSLYTLLKLMDDSSSAKTSMIGITNDAGFIEGLDPRVRSRLSQESVIFPPYNASELRDILQYRVENIVKKGFIDESALNLCAAIGAQEHGDARKALDLMRIAIEIALREEKAKITDSEVYKARDKFEVDVIKEAVRTLPLQSKILLLSAIVTQEMNSHLMITGEIYENYRNICKELGYLPLSSRRISDLLSELEDFGILVTRTKSLGRYGRTRFIQITGQMKSIKKYLLEDEDLSMFRGAKITRQSRFYTGSEEKKAHENESSDAIESRLEEILNFSSSDIQD